MGEMRFAHFSHTTISLFARRSLHARPSSSRGCQRPPCAPLLSRTTISPLYIEAATLAHPLREAARGHHALRSLSSHNLTRLSHPTISLFARRSRHARPSSSRGCQRPSCAPLLSRTTISPLYIEAATLAHPLREAVLCGKDALRASFPHNTASLFGAAQPRESTPGILYHPFFMRGKS